MSLEAKRAVVHESLCEDLAIAVFNVTYDELNDQDKIRIREGASAGMKSFIDECVAEIAREKAVKPDSALDAFCKGVSLGKEQVR